MDNILDFIKSTKSLLNESLELFNRLESDITSDCSNIEVKEEKLIQAKNQFMIFQTMLSDLKSSPVKFKPKNLKNKVKLIIDESLINSKTDVYFSVRSILLDIVDKIVESHNVIEITDDEEDKDDSKINIFNIISKDLKENDKSICDIRVVLNDISIEKKINDIVNIDKVINKRESVETDEENNVDDLLILNFAAKEALLKDSDTESVVESESVKEMSFLIKECSVVLYDLSLINPDIKLTDIQDLKQLEKEVNRLCCIPKFKNKTPVAKNEKISSKLNTAIRKKISNIYQSDSDDSSEFSETKSLNSDFEVKMPLMAESPLSSTDCDSSVESEDSKRIFSNGKKKSKVEQTSRPNTRYNLTIPKLDNSTSESDIKSKTSSKKEKSTNKRRAIYCSLSENESESDASLSDLRSKVSKSKASTKKETKKSKAKKGKVEVKILPKKEIKSKEEEADEEIETRKNIHKIITNAKLSKATKTAAQLETERRKRIEERQKEYNKNATDDGQSLLPSITSLILEKDDDNILVEVAPSIVENLKPHQIDAVKFLWDCVIESVACLKAQEGDSEEDKKTSAVGGCVLAHCMGLGKTLSLIAFMHTMLTTSSLNLNTCLVVCPVNTALNWKKEWEMWMPADNAVNIFEVCSSESKKSKIQVVQEWYIKGGVLIIGYEMYRLLATGDNRTVRRKIVKQKLSEALVNPGPDFVVCDEGHLLKNDKSAISKVILKINTRRRIVLTGTPLQNRLLEYHTMVQFVKPNLLGTQKEFLNRFVNPIHNGQHINSTPYDVSLMKKRSHILFKMLDGCVHRRDYSALVKYLPPKYEYVIQIRLSDIQVRLYREYINLCKENKHSLFQDQLNFARIWTHPFVICMHQEIVDKKIFLADTDEDEESFINDGSDNESKNSDEKITEKASTSNNGVINLVSDDSDTDCPLKKKPKIQDKPEKSGSESDSSVDEVVRNWSTTSRSARRSNLVDSGDENLLDELKDNSPIDKHWWSDIILPEHEHQIEISGKLTVLFQILRKASDIGDKVIIFSQSLLVLDIIEKYLQELHEVATKVQEDLNKLNESIQSSPNTNDDSSKNSAYVSDVGYNSWVKGYDYDRMDGSTLAITRAEIQSRFNSFEDLRLRLFLISTRAGGMGVNLVSANRVVIFDVSWNPSHDIQAIFRSYRFGQNKPVYVYRLVSQGTMEEKIYERQVTKQSLSLRVVDEQQISRYFTEEDLRSLYKFEPDIYDPEKVRETPILPKDRFLAELIQELPQFVHSYHEHDSLLQNKTEEELTESERQEAWKEFEEEKIHGTRNFVGIQPRPVQDQIQMQQYQHTLLPQQSLQYATLYSQNYNHLVKYVLARKPDINQVQLNNEVQNLFIQSLQKYYNVPISAFSSAPTDPNACGSQMMK